MADADMLVIGPGQARPSGAEIGPFPSNGTGHATWTP